MRAAKFPRVQRSFTTFHGEGHAEGWYYVASVSHMQQLLGPSWVLKQEDHEVEVAVRNQIRSRVRNGMIYILIVCVIIGVEWMGFGYMFDII